MRKIVALPLTAGLMSVPLLLAAPASAAADDATVTVVHGVPGLTVDIFADGDEILSDVEPGTVSKALTVPSGSYDLQIFADGDGPSGTPALSKDGVDVAAGANATVAAHLTADGKPALSVFANDTSAVPEGKARVTVRHIAAAPAVDVRGGGTVLFDNLTNGKEAGGEVAAGPVEADVVVAGTDTVAIGPADLDLPDGSNTVVYAWGSTEAGYALATQSVKSGSGTPSGVNAGTAGLADPGSPTWAPALAGLAGVAALAAGGVLSAVLLGTRRRQSTR